MLRRGSVGGLAAWAAVAVCILGGCGGSEDAPEAALEDGVVTDAEYQAAIDAQVSCLKQRGFDAAPYRVNGELLWTVSVSSDGSEEADNAASAAQDECYAEHVVAVERQYFHSHVPTGAERDALFVDFAACLESYGVHGAVPSWTESQVVDAIIEANGMESMDGLECLNQFMVLYPEGILPE